MNMKFIRTAMFVTTILAMAATVSLAAPTAEQSFDQLKTLAGQWETKTPNGKTATVSYRVMANGSSVVSEIDAPDDNMISVFHMDKDRLLLTHYCAAGNQPRMQATSSADGKVITFDFIDGTNILPSQGGHMRRLVITMADADHHSEEWVFAGNDGKDMRETFELQRKK
jgi:hypothetical protein